MAEKANPLEDFISPGSEIAGGLAGAAVGIIMGGAGGAFAGAVTGPIVADVCRDLYQRVMGPREQIRGGAAAAYAIVGIDEKLHAGEQPRSDGFFESDGSRPAAAEIFEGIVLKARDEHEEKKLRHYSRIFVTGCFDPSFSRSELNHAMMIAQRLTFTQMCLLALTAEPHPIPLVDHTYEGEHGKGVSWETYDTLTQLFRLHQDRLIEFRNPAPGEESYAVLSLAEVNPSWSRHTPSGDRLWRLMELSTIAFEDLRQAAAPLGGQVGPVVVQAVGLKPELPGPAVYS